ncbi:MAG: sulfotransferase family 2 domain-containing protein [Pseudomonadota bacterium]
MIVSHTNRFVFVHAPKTGGTSLATALERHLEDGDITIGDTPLAKDWRKRFRDRPKQNPRIWKHSTLAEIERWLGEDAVARYRVVTLVRDPWDRLVSYYHWARAQDWEHPATRAAKALDFADFAAHPAGARSMFSQPARFWVTGRNGTVRCDRFLRLEHMAEEAQALGKLLNVEIGPVPHINQSAADNHRAAYSAGTAALVRQLAWRDIAEHGYAF